MNQTKTISQTKSWCASHWRQDMQYGLIKCSVNFYRDKYPWIPYEILVQTCVLYFRAPLSLYCSKQTNWQNPKKMRWNINIFISSHNSLFLIIILKLNTVAFVWSKKWEHACFLGPRGAMNPASSSIIVRQFLVMAG